MYFNAWECSVRPKHLAYIDEITKISLWLTAVHTSIFRWYTTTGWIQQNKHEIYCVMVNLPVHTCTEPETWVEWLETTWRCVPATVQEETKLKQVLTWILLLRNGCIERWSAGIRVWLRLLTCEKSENIQCKLGHNEEVIYAVMTDCLCIKFCWKSVKTNGHSTWKTHVLLCLLHTHTNIIEISCYR